VKDSRTVGEGHHGNGVNSDQEIPHPVQGVHLSRKQLIWTTKVFVNVLKKT
jgi:hypothetical protein